MQATRATFLGHPRRHDPGVMGLDDGVLWTAESLAMYRVLRTAVGTTIGNFVLGWAGLKSGVHGLCEPVDEQDGHLCEPVRDCRGLQLLRGWGYDEQDNEQIFG